MIVRILGEGQRKLDERHLDAINVLDTQLEKAVDSGDEAAFRAALDALLAKVREVGEPLPDDSLEDSDIVLPRSDSTLAEVRAELGNAESGLVPG